MTSDNDDRTNPATRTERSRDSGGRYARELELADRDAAAAQLRKRGKGYQQIADELGISKTSAFEAVQRALAEIIREPGESLRAMELERLDTELEKLDEMEQMVRDILSREHVTVSQGRVVYDESSGAAVRDDAIILQCVDRLGRLAEQRRKNGESRRKLLGMDQPPKVEVTGGITYEIIGISPADLT